MTMRGFTLVEMMIALAISSLLMLAISRFLPFLTGQHLRQLMAIQLSDEVERIAFTLEKSIRRAGYCHGICQGSALHIMMSPQPCLLLRWDTNSNGRWEEAQATESERYGFRLRDGNLEVQRGVNSCQESGWEKLNDPHALRITQWQLSVSGNAIQFQIEAAAVRWPSLRFALQRRVYRENTDVAAAGS